MWRYQRTLELEDARVLVHGDDFLCLADDEGQKKIEDILRSRYDYKIVGSIGPEAHDGTTLTVINRILTFDREKGVLLYEADPRHAELIIRELQLEKSRTVVTPGQKKNLPSR